MYKSPDGWSQYTETWSVRTLFTMMNRNQLQFDWGKQRGYVWNKSKVRKTQKSHSKIQQFQQRLKTFKKSIDILKTFNYNRNIRLPLIITFEKSQDLAGNKTF